MAEVIVYAFKTIKIYINDRAGVIVSPRSANQLAQFFEQAASVGQVGKRVVRCQVFYPALGKLALFNFLLQSGA